MMQARYDAVQGAIKQIRGMAAPLHEAATRQEICGILEALATQTDLFPTHGFTVRSGATGGIYELYVAPDRSLSLYASSGASGKYQPPHDHTTWAVIAGIRGVERNQFFDCVERDDSSSSGKLSFVSAKNVGPGDSVTLGAEDFHTIAVQDGGDALHLHLYGHALDTLVGRIGFASETGGAFKQFMANPQTFAPWVNQEELEAMQADGLPLLIQSVTQTDLVSAVKAACAEQMPRIVLVDVTSEVDPETERRVRELQRAGFHNLAVLHPARV